MSPAVDPPTEKIIWGGPYIPPIAWKQTAGPCTCSCLSCETWIVLDGPAELAAKNAGNCYSARIGSVLLPAASTLTAGWCITVKALDIAPFGVFSQLDVLIYIDGAGYRTVMTQTTMCICFDGEKFVATGDAHEGGRPN